MKIAVSRLTENYDLWLKQAQAVVEWIDFYDREPDEVARQLQSCSGLLLTGGGDIAPHYYGRADYANLCRSVDRKRDEVELRLTNKAVKLGLPVLAVCRGMQMLNVAFGGTLIPDIPAFMSNALIHKDQEDVSHPVSVVFDSQLYGITGVSEEVVNSSHHQAIDRLAAGFLTSAVSPDGVIEAIDYMGGSGIFCMGVQWHPERMMISNPLSGKLSRAFLEAMKTGTRDKGQGTG